MGINLKQFERPVDRGIALLNIDIFMDNITFIGNKFYAKQQKCKSGKWRFYLLLILYKI